MTAHKALCYARLLAIALTVFNSPIRSQFNQNIQDQQIDLPNKLLHAINVKTQKHHAALTRSTDKYLKKLQRDELKLKKKLFALDSSAANETFGNVVEIYNSWGAIDSSQPWANVYSGHIDSMKTALQFLNAEKLLHQSPLSSKNYDAILSKYAADQQILNKSHFLEEQLIKRQQMLKEKIQAFGLAKDFNKYLQKIYYFRQEINEYKNVLNNPAKIESALMQIVNKIPSFRQFFNKYSQLASLFRLPGSTIDVNAATPGLQTRDMIAASLQERFGTTVNVQQQISSGMSAAQPDLEKAKDKFRQLGQSGSDMDMPDFKPNNQKTKSFLKRLEVGTNVQSTKSNSFLPVTTDLGLSVGYKINSKSVAGIGASYKMGWGKDIRHISLTHEGVGVRTFAEYLLKSNFWITGGGEWNFRSRFKEFEQLKNHSYWQESVLIGVSKKYRLSKKFKGSVQLLYDFLSAKSYPVSDPIKFRCGYNF